MNRILLVLALVAFGCGQTPPSKPVDQQAIGKEMAAFRVACSYSQFLKIQNNQVKNLFEFECFPELDSYLNRLDQLDSVETLCTLTSLLLQLRKTQDNGTLPLDGLPFPTLGFPTWPLGLGGSGPRYCLL